MKSKIVPLLMVLGFSMFCGIVGVSMGLGSILPPLHQVAAPLVCGNQQLEVNQDTYSYRPGVINVDVLAACVDKQNGTKRDVTTLLLVLSGTIYGAMIFILAMAGLNRMAKRLDKPWEKIFEPSVSRR